MLIRVLITISILTLLSCTTQKETKDAVFWRKKYEALNAYVKRKGLKEEADRLVVDLEKSLAVYHFTVFQSHYSLNGKDIQKSLLSAAVKNLKGEKSQQINIMAMNDAPHQSLLFLMNELSLNGFKNFNLTSERNLKPAP